MIKIVNEGAKSDLPFSPAIIAGDFVYVSGQASVDPERGNIITDTFEGEMRRSFDNMEAILKAAGVGYENVINVRSYVNDPDDLPLYNEIYKEYFSEPRPSRSTIVGVLGKALKFEVDCVAYVKDVRK